MDQHLDKHVKEIMSGVMCPKGFMCYKEGFKNLSKARDVGLEGFLECLELRTRECSFSTPYGSVFYCSCPLRVYIAKNLEK
jgi:hypothetical protein